MDYLYLKPKKGARVLNPDQSPPRPLPENGLRVANSLYWQRRLQEGVVELCNPPKTPAAPKKSKEPA